MPTIQQDLDFSQADLQWVINSYTLFFGGFLLLGGRAADIFGRKRIFIAGTILFSVASLLNGLAQNSEQLIAFRALQGLGGALVSPAALSIITTTFPEGPERTKALGVWSAIAAGGGAIGLLLGGILTEALSWEWIFFVNVPVGAVAAVLSARLITESKAERAGSFDVLGAVFVTAGLMVLVYAIVKAESFGWGSARTLGLAAVGIALLAIFVFIESRISGPLVRLGIFKIRSLAVATWCCCWSPAACSRCSSSPRSTSRRSWASSRSRPASRSCRWRSSSASARAPRRSWSRSWACAPTRSSAWSSPRLGLFYLSRVTVDGSYWTDLFPGLVLMAFGMGNTFVPITLIATTNVDEHDAGLASGLFNTSQQVGGALGLAVLSTLAADRTASYLAGLGHQPGPQEMAAGLVEGFQVAFTSAAILVTSGRSSSP